MWLFTRYGFFSVVSADPAAAKANTPSEPELMVRARVRQHLQNLQYHFPSLSGLRIIETPKADYRYRLIVPKSAWADVSRALADEIDYSNFKGECEASTTVDSAYVEMLHAIWDLHYEPQQRSIKGTEVPE